MQALQSTLPILAALAFGWMAGRWLLSERLSAHLIALIGPLVWMLLFLVGIEFGSAVSSLDAIGFVLGNAALLVVATTAVPCALLLVLSRLQRGAAEGRGVDEPAMCPRAQMASMLPALKECALAVLIIALGILCSVGVAHLEASGRSFPLPSSNAALNALIVLVGVDLSKVAIQRSWVSWRTLSVPVAVVLGSLIGAAGVHALTGEDLRLLLALSTGFGWFTLSSALVGSLSGELHGATALFVDLGRELVAIVLLYLMGSRRPHVGIAAAGATAMDSTLPIVRQTCRPQVLPVALVSGFVLTLLAPVFITAFLG